MRFILLALLFLGGAFYISNPQAFGAKGKFQIAENGRVERNRTGGANVDFGKIGEFGAGLFNRFVGSSTDSAPVEATDPKVAPPLSPPQPTPGTNAPEAGEQSNNTRILSVRTAPDLGNYDGRLAAIASAMQNNPASTTAEMNAATMACLGAQSPTVLSNYLVALVQLVAETSQYPKAEQAALFKAKSAPLTEILKAWLTNMPQNARAQAAGELQSWASRPEALVACHLGWLEKG